MVGVAEASGDRSVLFPEGAALAWGAWAMGRQDWRRLGPRLAITPALCAVCGVAATILLPSRLTAELTALTAAIAIIAALRAQVGPALSAAVLPAVAGIRNWWYVLSVCVIAAAVLGGALAREHLMRPASKGPDPPSGSGAGRLLITWTVTAAWLSVAAGLALPLAASAPPLLASAFEWVNSGKRGDARAGSRHGVVLMVAWTAGAVAAWHVRPPAASAAIALVIAAIVMGASRVMHPPAVAVALVPLVLGPPATWGGLVAGACSVAAAVTVLYASGSAGLRLAAGQRWPRPPSGREHMSQGATGLRQPIKATNRSQP
jgi:uncharacterized membrane protein YoaK (UPF0700 family)